MAIFCIPKEFIEKLKDSFSKGMDIAKLYEMTPKESHDFFVSKTDEELGSFLNAKFTEAKLSERETALTDFFKSTMTPKERAKPVYKNMLDKIQSLKDMGALTVVQEKAVYEDLISDKLGVTITPEEIKTIDAQAKLIQESQKILGNNLGDPAFEEQALNFLIDKKVMDEYLLSLNPANNLKVLTGTIGRAAMLASLKSPLLNVGSNIEVGLTESIARRISAGTVKGTDNKLAKDYIAMVNRIYKKTGYDISRMTKISDTGASGGRILGKTVHSQGKGGVRFVGRIAEDVIFKTLMGAPDVAFASVAFADSVNLRALEAAGGNETRARELMVDAMRLEPQDDLAKVLRAQAILDAQTATWTNKTWASSASEGIRTVLNSVSGDIRAGDYLLPFIKTPANVIATGIDYAGGGPIKALYKTVNAIRTKQKLDRKFLSTISTDLVRGGMGIVGALIIAANLDDDDFVGAYDPARAQIEALRGSNYNAIKIGNRWISTDWFGPLAIPLTAMLYARKYGDTLPELGFQYAKSLVSIRPGDNSAVQQIPGIKDVFEYAKSGAYNKESTLNEMAGETGSYILEQVWSRLIPSIVSDAAKAIDTKERETNNSTIKTIQNKIPIARNLLPERKNVFGETVNGEPWWSDLLFGTRLKTSTETALVKEISDLSLELDKGIAFTNWDKSSSMVLASFKEKVGEERFNKAKLEYGQKLQQRLEKIIESSQYKNLDPEDQLRLINGADADVIADIYKKYGFKYKAEKKTKLPKI